MYLPKLTRPIFSTKMSRFAPACPVIFILSDLSLSRTPWGTYMNCNKKKTITTANQKYPVICFFNLHEEIKSDKGKKRVKKTPFLSTSCMWTYAHTNSFYINIHISVHQLDVIVGFNAPHSQKTKFPNLVQWRKRIWQFQQFDHWLHLPITCAPTFSFTYSYNWL